MNNTGVDENEMADLVVDKVATAFMCILYVSLGCVGICCNTLNLAIYYSSRHLRKKYMYFMALDFGELVNAISYILVGSGRGFGLINGYIQKPITLHDCFYKRYWVHSLILGTELPGYCIVLISVERMFAVLKPGLYNRIFLGPYKVLLLACIPFAGLTSVAVGGISALGEEGNRIISTQHCPIISSTAIWYSTYHFLAITLVYVVSFTTLLIVKYRTKEFANLRDSRIDLMLAITGTSIILVGSSAFVMITIRWNIFAFGDVVVALTYAMPGFLSVFNTALNLSFRQELRQQLLYLFGFRDSGAGGSTLGGRSGGQKSMLFSKRSSIAPSSTRNPTTF